MMGFKTKSYNWSFNGYQMYGQCFGPKGFSHFSLQTFNTGFFWYFEFFIEISFQLSHFTNVCFLVISQEFFSVFSKQCPCVLSRSILQLIFMPNQNKKVFGMEMLPDVLRDCVRTFVCPPALAMKSPLYNSAQVKDMTDALLLHSVRVSLYLEIHWLFKFIWDHWSLF